MDREEGKASERGCGLVAARVFRARERDESLQMMGTMDTTRMSGGLNAN